MPRYYMRLEPSGIEDTEGEELSGPEAAIKMANAFAEDLTRVEQQEPRQHLVVVKDEAGAIVYERALIVH